MFFYRIALLLFISSLSFAQTYKELINNGLVFEKKFLYDQAIKEYDKAIQKDSTNYLAYYRKAITYQNIEKTQDLANYYSKEINENLKKSIILNPEEITLYLALFEYNKLRNAYLLGQKIDLDNDYDQIFKKAIQLAPESLFIIENYVIYLNSKGKYKEAIDELEKLKIKYDLIELNDTNYFILYDMFTNSYLSLKDTIQACYYFELKNNYLPSTYSIVGLRDLYYSSGNYLKALTKNEEIIKAFERKDKSLVLNLYEEKDFAKIQNLLIIIYLYYQMKVEFEAGLYENGMTTYHKLKKYINLSQKIIDNLLNNEYKNLLSENQKKELLEAIVAIKQDNFKYLVILTNLYLKEKNNRLAKVTAWKLSNIEPNNEQEYYLKYHLLLDILENYKLIEQELTNNYKNNRYPVMSLFLRLLVRMRKLSYSKELILDEAKLLKTIMPENIMIDKDFIITKEKIDEIIDKHYKAFD
ncbi:MAG: hypothetical protein QXG00_07535 [Candidatus Woesearchaeota archaeon]